MRQHTLSIFLEARDFSLGYLIDSVALIGKPEEASNERESKFSKAIDVHSQFIQKIIRG